MDVPETRYVKTVDGVSIAYQVLGAGSPSIVVANSAWFSNVEQVWDFSPPAALYRGLAARGTMVLFDRRGTGLSDKVSGERLPALDAKMDDIRAVIDAVGFERVVLYGMEDAAATCFLFAATYPERTQAVISVGGSACGVWPPGTGWGLTEDGWEREIEDSDQRWGTRGYSDKLANIIWPSHKGDEEFLHQYGRLLRSAMSSADALAALRMWRDTDVRHVLPQIQAPTLVMHHTQDQDVEVAEARYTADQIPGAVFVELPGVDRTPGDLSAVDRFLSSLREEEAVLDRVLATVMFTDVVDSTAQAAEAGDRHWQELMQHHQSDARALLGRYRGTEMNTTGDGFFATFDGPARGIRCAQAIVEATRKLGIQIRAGLHTGEVQLVGDKAEGMAVNIAARVCAHAGSSEVLASHTVKDLVAGSGLEFQDLGEHQLKGVPDTWRLFRVADA